MRALSLRGLLGAVLFYAVQIADAQLPDSIPDNFGNNCAAQREKESFLCCAFELEGRNFCPMQCENDICQCVDTVTGEQLVGIPVFSESQRSSFSCTPPIPPPTIATAAEASTTPEATDPTTDSPTTADPTTDSPTTADPTTDSPTTADPTTDSPTTADPTTDSPTTADPTTDSPTTADPTTDSPTTADPTTDSPTTADPTTDNPMTADPTTTDPDYFCDRSGSKSRSRGSRRGTKSKSKGSRSRHTDSAEEISGSGSGSGLDCSDSSRSRNSRSKGSRSSKGTGTGTGRGRSCKTVRQMRRSGCADTCLKLDSDKCPVCDLECNRRGVNSNCDCGASQTCTRRGLFGVFQCVDRPGEGEMCGGEEDTDESEDETSRSVSVSRESTGKRRKRRVSRHKVRGATERYLFGNIEEAEIECQDGSTCVEATESMMECRPEDANSNCIQAQRKSSSITCTPEGYFDTLQCLTQNGTKICRCVHPSDGTRLPGSPEVTIATTDDTPNCDVLVFKNCTMKVGDEIIGVAHQDYMVEPALCRRCLCNNGQLEDCEHSQTCESIQRNPKTCTYKGQTVAHGGHIDVDCNKCGCYNGDFSCTRKRCKDKPLSDRCSTCDKKRVLPVCGPNGVTYQTRCDAVYCAGQLPFRLVNGACYNQDMCSRYPCSEGKTCVRKGGLICVGNCKAEDVRTCVNVNELTCPSQQDMSEDGVKLCATNGVTYSSLCRLLQDSKKEHVAYVGECGSESCSGGEVCGADMVTYDNICQLRSTSNARFDYSGNCLDGGEGNSIVDICGLVSESGVCRYSSTNCERLVPPRGGCCPICGGVLLVAINLRGLREYFKINPPLRNFDSLYEVLAGSEILTGETTERCDVEITLADRNLEIILSVKALDDQDFCSSESERIAEFFNNPTEYTSFIPDVLQFSRAAVSLGQTQLVEDLENVDGLNGAMAVASTSVTCIVMAAMAVLQ